VSWQRLLQFSLKLRAGVCFVKNHIKSPAAMLFFIESEIFAKDEKAKIVAYVGANHVIEQKTYEGIYLLNAIP
jgi:hypothetical protein